MSNPIVLVLAMVAALATTANAARAQIAIDREAVLLNPTQPGERMADIVVRNNGVTNVEAVVRLEDWDLDVRGESRWQSAGRVAGSCGNRVTVTPHVIKLAPGAHQTVRIAVQGRAKFDAECWSAAVVEPIGSASLKDTNHQTAEVNSIRDMSARATVPLYVTPSGLAIDGELRNMYVKSDSLEMVYENTGKMRTDIVGELQVRTSDGSVLTAVPIDQTTVLAGATRTLRLAMPKLAKGKYTLYAIIDFGGAQMTAVEAALEIQ